MTGRATWIALAAGLGLMANAALSDAPDAAIRPVARTVAEALPAGVTPTVPESELAATLQASILATGGTSPAPETGSDTAPETVAEVAPAAPGIGPQPRPFAVLMRGLRQAGPPPVPAQWIAALDQGLPLPLLLILDTQHRAQAAPLLPRYAGLDGNGIAPGPLAVLSSVQAPGARLSRQEARLRNGSRVSVDVGRLSRLFASTLSNRVRISRPDVIVVPDETMLSAALDRPGVRPQPRPGSVAEEAGRTTNKAPVRPGLRPMLRPVLPEAQRRADLVMFVGPDAARPGGDGAAIAPPTLSEQAVAVALVPPNRPEAITQAYIAARAERARGAVCGNPDIQGRVVDPVGNGGGGGCGIANPVRVTSVSDVRLSTPATIDCTTAEALNRWVRQGARPAIGNTGGGIAELRIMGSYSCRTRNNQSGARLSEHAKGRALDIGGIVLRDGNQISVLRHWGSNAYGAALRQMHRAACGRFGTVLGPDANAAHRDHFHFDTARYRSGSYCR
ncbi:extensin family protein [Flavimaricola marinus]|uniref:Extensin-like C-terminal domain-containing protein n=1 Tax=Flavimaricola marinus TaxID=1819565 RepID=A0A238L8G0_9RHOB|nr:extensin family protein [Flavimaricola marinus]SMY05969.1 hypothetical protein LOM8899_00090 [Flavimaricola marinus]